MTSDMQRLVRLSADLYSDFLRLKHDLVHARKIKYGDNRAEFLNRIGWDSGHLLDFEEYDYDPTASELREYALAVGMAITTKCTDRYGGVTGRFVGTDDALNDADLMLSDASRSSHQQEKSRGLRLEVRQ